MDNQLILYRLSPNRGSRDAIDTHFEMGFCANRAVRDSQCLQKYKKNMSHIRILFLTFIWKFCPELLEKGYIYAAVPPLYKATMGTKIQYIKDDAALEAFRKTGRKFELGRMKGLGEMDTDELAETVMDREHRTLKQITVEDAVAATKIFNELMGETVEFRKKFIEANAWRANVDV